MSSARRSSVQPMPREFVPMPTPDGKQYTCTGSVDPVHNATSGCRNCGTGRCKLHPNEPHIPPCRVDKPFPLLPAGLRFIPDDNGGHMIDDAGQVWSRK